MAEIRQESGNGDRTLPDSGGNCFFVFCNFFVRAKRLKIFLRKSFFFKMISSKIFYYENYFISKQTDHKCKNYILLKESENTSRMMQEFNGNFGIRNYINKIQNLINIFKNYEWQLEVIANKLSSATKTCFWTILNSFSDNITLIKLWSFDRFMTIMTFVREIIIL
jgi:hypothetical protein